MDLATIEWKIFCLNLIDNLLNQKITQYLDLANEIDADIQRMLQEGE